MRPRTVSTAQIVSPKLVARATELSALLSTLGRPPAVAVVEGEAGIGKTRLVTELASLLDGPLVLTGGCGHIREPFPLGPVLEALRGTGERLAAAALSPVAGALRPLLPEIAHVLPVAPEPLGDRVGERHRVFRGLAELLATLGTVVLVLEDMHWADEQTVEFLGYLLSDPPPGLCVVLTYRGEEVGVGARALTARLPAAVARTQVVLAPFGTAETQELAASILGTAHVSEDFALYLRERTSGLPFAIQELLALLRARGTLVRRGGGWARKTIDELDVPAGVRDSVLERVSRLSPAARAVVEAGAVLEAHVPIAALLETCRAPEGEAANGLDEALERGLLVERSGLVGFRHLLAVQAVYGSVPLSRRRDLHARAGATVGRLSPVPLGQVAHHLRHSGQLDAWVAAAEKAADQATALGDDDEAAHLLEAVLRHAPLAPIRRAELAVKLGWASTRTLKMVDEVGVLSAALEHDPPQPLRGELRFLYALGLDRTAAEPRLQWQAFTDAVESLDGRPDLVAQAMVGLGLPTTPDVPLAEHVGWLERALEQLPAIDDAPLRAFVLGKVAMVLTAVGDPRWAELADRLLAQTGGSPVHRREVGAFCSLGEDACYAGRYEISDRLLSAALLGAPGCDLTRWMEFNCRASLVVLAYARGAWAGLPEEIAFLSERLVEHPRELAMLDTVKACLTLASGDLEESWPRLLGVIERALRMGAIDLLPIAMGALLRQAAAQGSEPPGSVAATCAVWDTKRLWPVAVRVLPPLVEALVTAGRREEAGALVSRLDRELGALDAPLAPPSLAHARGLLAANASDWAAASAEFLTAVDGYDLLGCLYEAAQARELAASCLVELGDGRAAELLNAALAAYESLGARWDLDRASRLARRVGVPSPARHRGGPYGYGGDLSPREREVAQLAATGLTNKEIAKDLFLSTKTVDKHLSAALRKLGLRSRAALARRLDGEA
ncbi:helix-turn-helix transcriptional regulator [Microtetraspora malaysiensis]|uniref:helix-turn-helix transcriptional regulator n=1 Tax=Microtetraspora malaysiensis TaxID=161358 RepID=UPI003D8C1A88